MTERERVLCVEVLEEMKSGYRRYGPIVSNEDGLCRLMMEVDELAAAVRDQSKARCYGGEDKSRQVAQEAVQVASLALRLAQHCRLDPASEMC